MMNFYQVYLKHSLRNTNKTMPPALVGLGKLGHILASSTLNFWAFVVAIAYVIYVVMNISIEEENFSILFGINPIALVIAMLSVYIYIDAYSEGMQTAFNKKCLDIFPLPLIKKYYMFYSLELISRKILFFLFLGFNIAYHQFNTPFITFNQGVNLYIILTIFHIFYNNIIVISKLLWIDKSRTNSYFIIYAVILIVIGLVWKSEEVLTIIEQNMTTVIVITPLVLGCVNYFCYLIFKKITTFSYFLK